MLCFNLRKILSVHIACIKPNPPTLSIRTIYMRIYPSDFFSFFLYTEPLCTAGYETTTKKEEEDP